jgi:alkylhydroperoxidase family enzyme
MPSRIEHVRRGDAADGSVNELLREAEEGWYGDAAFFGVMAHQPTLLERIVSVFRVFPQSEQLSPETLELMRLKIADLHRCAYCATVRTVSVRDDVSPKEEAVFGKIDSGPLTRREELAVRLAEGMSTDPHRITDEFFDELRAAFDDATLIELLLFVSLEIGLDRFCIALTLDTTEESRYPSGLEYPFERSQAGPGTD